MLTLDGEMIIRNEFDGELIATNEFDGELLTINEFDGELSTSTEFDGELNISVSTGGIKDYYDGDYLVTPQTSAQILDTEEKFMAKDVEIEAIPYAEVSNLADGKTVIIA